MLRTVELFQSIRFAPAVSEMATGGKLRNLRPKRQQMQ
jgi:hypothetical protein